MADLYFRVTVPSDDPAVLDDIARILQQTTMCQWQPVTWARLGTCQDCRWWKRDVWDGKSLVTGTCRTAASDSDFGPEFPDVQLWVSTADEDSAWLTTYDLFTCAEWQPKEIVMPKTKNPISKITQSKSFKKGALHQDLGVPADQPIPKDKLEAAASKPGVVGRRARFAETLEGLRKKGKSK